MNNTAVGLFVVSWLACAAVRADADASTASMSPADVRTALTAIQAAKKIAEAGRTTLLMAGSTLSTDELASRIVVALLEEAKPEELKAGSILLLAKKNCEPVDDCLVARRFIGRDSSGNLQTERYGFAQPILLDSIRATLLGSVAYAVDLETGDIHDLRPDRKSERVSVADAVAQEARR